VLRTVSAVIAILAVACGVQIYRAGHAPPLTHQANELVPVASADQVLALIRQGKKVVFIDAREEQEWQEEHIPGAINLSLREVGQLDRATLGHPDLVIAYCLKDFRGFEVAKALQNAGVPHSSILAEFGINGWKQKGLPTVLANQRSEEAAVTQLQACAAEPAQCTGKLL
jgi:rhodanese-related sulfurtransferase